jgi:hypothetical protein
MRSRYAVLWCSADAVEPGRLELTPGGFELRGRGAAVSVLFADLRAAAIARGRGDRLRGLPVLALHTHAGAYLRIASLEGSGVLHELAERIERAGLRAPV